MEPRKFAAQHCGPSVVVKASVTVDVARDISLRRFFLSKVPENAASMRSGLRSLLDRSDHTMSIPETNQPCPYPIRVTKLIIRG